MAVYLLMKKEEENENMVIYSFGPNEVNKGCIQFNKKDMKFIILSQVNDNIISNEAYEQWACERIIKVIIKEKGGFPETMYVEK